MKECGKNIVGKVYMLWDKYIVRYIVQDIRWESVRLSFEVFRRVNQRLMKLGVLLF